MNRNPDSIIFYLPRINGLRTFGPLASEMRRRNSGFRVVVAVAAPPLISMGGKMDDLAAHLNPAGIRLAIGQEVQIEQVNSGAALRELIRKESARAVFTTGLIMPGDSGVNAARPSRADGVIWCSVGHLSDELLQLVEDGPKILEDWDLVGSSSPAFVEEARKLVTHRNRDDPALLDRVVPVGLLELDQLADIDREAARAKYEIPDDARVVFFSTAAQYPVSRLQRVLFYERLRRIRLGRLAPLMPGKAFRGISYLATYPQIIAAVRRFADRHNAVLLGKTRAKHLDAGYVERSMDRLYEDGSYYPYRTLELLVASDYYVGVVSASSLEATAVGIPGRTILPFPSGLWGKPEAVNAMRAAIYEGATGVWEWPGISELFKSYELDGWRKMTAWASEGRWEDRIDSDAKNSWTKRILGFDDYSASKRFMDEVEARLN